MTSECSPIPVTTSSAKNSINNMINGNNGLNNDNCNHINNSDSDSHKGIVDEKRVSILFLNILKFTQNLKLIKIIS